MGFSLASYWQKKRVFFFLSCGWFIFCIGCSPAEDSPVKNISAFGKVEKSEALVVPKDLLDGEARFHTFCAKCHGTYAKGTQKGPPLVHKIYEPSHHGDGAFLRAATQGVRAHHWEFGNMPKIAGVTVEEVMGIVQYIRWLQRRAGVY